MIRYYKKFYFLKVYENWFEYRFSWKAALGLNMYWHVKNQLPASPLGVKSVSHTLELDLRQAPEQILAGYNKQIRQQIRIAETEGISCVHENNIPVFVEFYNDFARKRNTHLVSQRRMEEFGDRISLSFAYYNGELVAAHSYLTDPETGMVRHHHAATRRLDEQMDKNLIGRANKLLTTVNIQRFREAGFHTFDFGGYAKDTTDKGLQGINRYKEMFGGTLVESHNYCSYPYWMLKKISGLLGMGGKV